MDFSLLLQEQFSQEKIKLFDSLVEALYNQQTVIKFLSFSQKILRLINQTQMANQVLTQLKENPYFYRQIDQMLLYAKNEQSKFICLVILEDKIKHHWQTIQNKNELHEFISNIINSLLQMGERPKNIDLLLQKSNTILVHILGTQQVSQISPYLLEIIQNAYKQQNVCNNVLAIFKLFHQEILSKKEKQQQLQELQTIINKLIELIFYILQTNISQKIEETLVKNALGLYQAYLPSVQQNKEIISFFMANLQDYYLNEQQSYTVSIMQTSVKISQDFMQSLSMFQSILIFSQNLLQKSQKITSKFKAIGQFLCTFFTNNLSTLEQYIAQQNQQMQTSLISGLDLIILIASNQNVSYFTPYLSFFKSFSLNFQSSDHFQNSSYNSFCQQMIDLLIKKTVKPDFLQGLEINENQELVINEEDQQQDLYDLFKETLTKFASLDWQLVRQIINNSMEKQMDNSDFSLPRLDSLIFSIGALSHHIQNDHDFIVKTLKALLCITENQSHPTVKLWVVRDLLYLIQEFPLYLNHNYHLFQVVYLKLLEFLAHKNFLQNIAAQTLLTLTQKCGNLFIQTQQISLNNQPIIEHLWKNLPQIQQHLQPNNVFTFYLSLIHIISHVNIEQQQKIFSHFFPLLSQKDQLKMLIKSKELLTIQLPLQQFSFINTYPQEVYQEIQSSENNKYLQKNKEKIELIGFWDQLVQGQNQQWDLQIQQLRQMKIGL